MEQHPVIVRSVQPRRHRHLAKGWLLLWALILSLLYILTVRVIVPSQSDSSVAAETARSTPQPNRSTATYSAVGQTVADSSSETSCSGSAFMQQGSLSLETLPQGLHIEQDKPQIYTVGGTTLREIQSAIENCEYRQPAGDYHALTRYQLNWRYSLAESGGACRLVDTKVGMRISLLLPGLANTANLSDETRAAWQSYDTELRAHETGHVTINERHASELYQTLTSLRVGTCRELEAAAKRAITQQLAALNADHKSYDEHTDHGATQGARL